VIDVDRPPLRVLYLLNSLGTGGAERSLVEQATPLRDHAVELVVGVLEDRDEGVGYELDLPFEVHRIPDGRLPARLRALEALVDSVRPDVVHTTLFDADILGRALRTRRGVPLLCSLVNTTYESNRWRHDSNLRVHRVRMAQLLDVATCPAVDHFHAITHAVALSASSHLRIPLDRITVVPRGRSRERLGTATHERRLAVRELLALRDDLLVLGVGRHEPQKGFGFLIDAFSMVVAAHPGSRLMIAGRRGNASESIERRIADHRLQERVALLGHRTDVPDLLVAADVLAFPSTYEGLGGAVLEAMALRCPVVAADLPVLREVLAEDGAVFAPVGDPDALAAAILRVAANEDLRRSMTDKAFDRFESRYTLDRAVEGMAELYRDVADRRETPLQRMVRRGLAKSPAKPLARRLSRRRVAVLAYHDVPHRGQFERHLDYLQQHGTILSADELVSAVRQDEPVPDNPVFITFDDGDVSLAEHALPALRERGIPAAVFVVTSLVGSDDAYWWRTVEAALNAGAKALVDLPDDPAEAVRSLKSVPDTVRRDVVSSLARQHDTRQRNLTVADLRDLEASGILIGSHSMTHPILDRCTTPVITDEVQGSTDALREWLGHDPKLFAYPNGDHDPRVRDAVRRAGYDVAFGFDHRLVRPDRADPMRLSRVRIDARDSIERLELVVSGLEPALSRAGRRVT